MKRNRQRCIMLMITFVFPTVLHLSAAFEASRMQQRRRRRHDLRQHLQQPSQQMVTSTFRQSTMLLYTQEGYSDPADDHPVVNERQKLINLVHFLREMGITIDEYDTMIELLEDRQEEMLQRVCAIEELLETLAEVENGSANMERDHASYFAAKFQAIWEEEQLDEDLYEEDADEDDVLGESLDMMNTQNYVSVYPTDVSQLYGQSRMPTPSTSSLTSASSPTMPSGSFMYKLQNASSQRTPQKLRKIVNSFLHRMKAPSPRPPKQPPNIVNFLLQERNRNKDS